MGKFWTIVQRHLDEYGVRDAAFARQIGVRPQTLNSWKQRGFRQLPERSAIDAVARVTRQPYEVVLFAILADANYLEADSWVTRMLPSGEPPTQAERAASETDRLFQQQLRNVGMDSPELVQALLDDLSSRVQSMGMTISFPDDENTTYVDRGYIDEAEKGSGGDDGAPPSTASR